jgi:Protein of unknown function (DUF2283)
MAARLTFTYDREADILHIDTCPPYAEQESEELGDEVVARLNPETGPWRTWRCCSSPRGCYGANFSSCRSRQSYGPPVRTAPNRQSARPRLAGMTLWACKV